MGLKINAMVYVNWQCFLVVWKIVVHLRHVAIQLLFC